MNEKSLNYIKKIYKISIILLGLIVITFQSAHGATWSKNHKKAVKNECKIAVKNNDVLKFVIPLSSNM